MRCQLVALFLFVIGGELCVTGNCKRPAEHFPSLPESLPVKDIVVQGPHGIQMSRLLQDHQIALVFFGYTHCPQICPDMLKRLGRSVSLMTKEHQKRVAIVFVSVDTERDSPESAVAFAKRFYDDIVTVSGTEKEIRALAAAYSMYVGSRGSEIDHSTSVIWLEAGPSIKKIVPHGFSPDHLADDLRGALR